MGDMKEGLGMMRRAVLADPISPYPWNGTAVVLASMGREEEALVCCRKAMERSKTEVGGWVNNAVIRINRGDGTEEEAKEELRRVAEHGVAWMGTAVGEARAARMNYKEGVGRMGRRGGREGEGWTNIWEGMGGAVGEEKGAVEGGGGMTRGGGGGEGGRGGGGRDGRYQREG